MGSVGTKDIKPYSIVAGNPAKIIKRRFKESIMKELHEFKWLKYLDNELLMLAKRFTQHHNFKK